MISIVQGQEDDLAAVCVLAEENLTWHAMHAPNAFIAGGIERDRGYWLSCLQDTDGVLLLAKDEALPLSEQLLGMAYLKMLPSAQLPFILPQKVCRISTIVVASRVRRRGIAQQLLDAAQVWSRQQGAVELKLEVFSFNEAAMALYQKNGYSVQSLLMNKVL